uniref:OB_Dis3 domain-containing protein n=1 Tax=Anopheles maculatus TaxID=74869 RepID=A0A182SN66_9DIPT
MPVAERLAADARQFLAEKNGTVAPSVVASTSKKERAEQSSQTASASKTKRTDKGTYEEQVNFLLNDRVKRPKDGSDRELLLNDIRDEADEIVQERLESFVGRLVEQKIGYIMDGFVRVNVRNNMQSFVDDPTRTGNIYINSILLRRCAMEGDLVRVFVFNQPPDSDEESDGEGTEGEEEEKPPVAKSVQNNAGFVVCILEKRHNRQCVGKFLPAPQCKKHYRMFAPRDMRIPPVRIFKQEWPNALFEFKQTKPKEDDAEDVDEDRKEAQKGVVDITEVLYQVQITEWRDDVPTGSVLKPIGKCGVLEVENESILVEHNLDVTPYGEDILVQLPAVPYNIPAEELARREDLRGECIFTIDPATARDLDDALSCK